MNQEEIFHAITTSQTRQESKAIQLLFKSYYSQAKYIVLRHTGLSVEDSECIFQDAVIEVVFRIKEGSFVLQGEDSIKRFILKYVKNRSLSQARKKSKFVNTIPDFFLAEEEDVVQIREEELISKIFDVASKSKNGKEIITRRFLDKQSYQQIENAMNYSKNSAKNGLYRAFESIRKEVKFDEYIIK